MLWGMSASPGDPRTDAAPDLGVRVDRTEDIPLIAIATIPFLPADDNACIGAYHTASDGNGRDGKLHRSGFNNVVKPLC